MGELDLNLLPPPTKVIDVSFIKIIQWGGLGMTLDETVVLKFGCDTDGIIRHILHNAEGVYFILLQDVTRQRWFFFTDRFSCKKIFYYQKRDTVFLCDFIYKLKPFLDTTRELDIAAMALYLIYGYIPTNQTLYRSVRSLKPFTYYVYDKNGLTSHRYYDIDFDAEEMSFEEAAAITMDSLESSFVHLTKDFDYFLIPLSGGRDSRLLLSLALKHYPRKRIKTLTFGQKGTYDFEIGKNVAKKYDVESILTPFEPKAYFDEYVVPGTKFKNGLINHSVNSPSKVFEDVLGLEEKTLIISGYIGDMVLAWSHGKELSRSRDNFLHPRANFFPLELIETIIGKEARQELRGILSTILTRLSTSGEQLEPERWGYLIHAPYYTNPCMFSEEKLYPFALPFITRPFLDFVRTIPLCHKRKESFYETVLKSDQHVYPLFSYPLKNLRAGTYGNKKVWDWGWKSLFACKAIASGARPMKNYVNFNSAYSDSFLQRQIRPLERFGFFQPILDNFDGLTFEQKCLLLSLRLNLETFF